MTFPWTTGTQRRQQREDEDCARRAALDLSLDMAGVKAPGVRGADGMAEILRGQREVNVLRPAREPFRSSFRRSRVGHSSVVEFSQTGT